MKTSPHLEVSWWDGARVGVLVNRGTIYFAYDEGWLRREHDLSPLMLPCTATAFNGAKGIDGLPGLIADCLPDAWGRKVAAKEFAARKWGQPSTMALLSWRANRGTGALSFQPALGEDGEPGNHLLATVSTAALARGAAAIERGEATEVLPQLARGGTAGGAFPKALVLVHPDGSVSVGPPDGIARPCMVKFDLSLRGDAAASEHGYARMAAAAGIHVVETALLAESARSRRRHLLVRRFDIPEGGGLQRRLHLHSLSGVLHRTPTGLDYTDLFRAAIRLGVPAGDIREIARRMVFNVLAANADDHGKNHAFLYDEDRRSWQLSPAYDLTYNAMMLERGMLVCGEVWPTCETMRSLCLDAQIRPEEFETIFDQVSHAVGRWSDFADAAGVSTGVRREIGERHVRIREVVGSGSGKAAKPARSRKAPSRTRT